MGSSEIVSLAILVPFEGQEEATLELLRRFYTFMNQKGYSSDLLYREAREPARYIHLRTWKSNELRTEAQNDPEVHRYWKEMSEVCQVTTTYEKLDQVFSTMAEKG